MKRNNWLLAGLLSLTVPATAQYNPADVYSYKAVASQTDPAVMEKLILLHEQKSPSADGFDYAKITCVQAYAEKGNLEKVKYWIGNMKSPDRKLEATSQAVEILVKNQYYDQAVPLLVPYVILDYTRVDTMRVLGSVPDARKFIALRFYYNYARILYHRKEYDAVEAFMVPINSLAGRNHVTSPYQDLYSLLLMNKSRLRDAIYMMKSFIKNGEEHDEEFIVNAKKLLGNEYNQVIDSINTATRRSTTAYAKKYVKSIQLPNTPLKGISGNDFYLKSLKGKTVVVYIWTVYQLNFQPNFLADLQQAKEYYEKDSNVVFIAVHSFENTATCAEEANAFLKKNNCNLDLYFDLKDKVSKNNPLATALKIHDEGTVLVLNKDGIGKYMETGVLFNKYGFERLKALVDVVKEK